MEGDEHMTSTAQVIGVMLILLDIVGLIGSLSKSSKFQVKWHEILLVANSIILAISILP